MDTVHIFICFSVIWLYSTEKHLDPRWAMAVILERPQATAIYTPWFSEQTQTHVVDGTDQSVQWKAAQERPRRALWCCAGREHRLRLLSKGALAAGKHIVESILLGGRRCIRVIAVSRVQHCRPVQATRDWMCLHDTRSLHYLFCCWAWMDKCQYRTIYAVSPVSDSHL